MMVRPAAFWIFDIPAPQLVLRRRKQPRSARQALAFSGCGAGFARETSCTDRQQAGCLAPQRTQSGGYASSRAGFCVAPRRCDDGVTDPVTATWSGPGLPAAAGVDFE